MVNSAIFELFALFKETFVISSVRILKCQSGGKEPNTSEGCLKVSQKIPAQKKNGENTEKRFYLLIFFYWLNILSSSKICCVFPFADI